MPRSLPPQASALLEELAELLGQDRLVLFGGAALDLLCEPHKPVKDLDVALPLDDTVITACINHLESAGYPPSRPLRRYWVNVDRPVLMTEVRWPGWVVDLNFVNGIEDVPPFDLDSVMWRFPEREVIDPYQAVTALEARTARPGRGYIPNNPYLLLNRLLRLAAKYQLRLSGNPIHAALIRDLNDRVARWPLDDDFHGRQALEAHFRTIPAAARRSGHPARFLADLSHSEALSSTLPAVARLFQQAPAAVTAAAAAVGNASSFWQVVESWLPPPAAAALGRLRASTASPSDWQAWIGRARTRSGKE